MPLAPSLQKFTTVSQAIASYSYNDIVSGLGYQIFSCFATINDTTISYGIGTSPIFSDPERTLLGTYGNASFERKLDLAFDTTPFNTARTASGVIFVNIPFGAIGSTNNSNVYCLVRVYHFDGSTETLLGSEQKTQTVVAVAN